LRQKKDLAKVENTAKNLSIALAEMNIEIKKTIKKISILTEQLEKISLFLIVTREEEVAMVLRIGCTIYRLITPRVQDEGTQIIKVTC
jgi:uncharacterized protein YwgA